MISALYLASGLALVACLSKEAEIKPQFARRHFFSIFREGIELFLLIIFLILTEFLIENLFPFLLSGELRIPYLLSAVFIISRIYKKDGLFFLTALALSFLIVSKPEWSGRMKPFYAAAFLVFIFTLTRTALDGLRFRLLFASPVPALKGLPILLFAFSIFLISFSVFKFWLTP